MAPEDTKNESPGSGARAPGSGFFVSGDRPPYRVPLMREIAKVPWNGRVVVSTFSGCGGSCLGFEMAGFKVLWANEFVPAAQETYRANHPKTHLDASDIRKVTAASIREVIGDVDVDVLEGSPPCASFSTAGKREEHWGQVKKYSDVEQRVDDLFWEYARLVGELRPKVFVAENVSGLVKGVAKGYFLEILAALKRQGYAVRAQVLDAQWLGVPQMRARVIFMGVRDDLAETGMRPAFPKPLPYRYSIRDALPNLATFRSGGHEKSTGELAPSIQTHGRRKTHSEFVAIEKANGFRRKDGGDSVDEPMRTVQQGRPVRVRLRGGKGAPFDSKKKHYSLDDPSPAIVGGQGSRGSHQVYVETVAGAHGFKAVGRSIDEPAPTIPRAPQKTAGSLRIRGGTSIEGYAIEGEWRRLKPGQTSEKYLNLSRPDAEKPSPTVTQTGGTSPGTAGVTHPYECRKFTIAELKRICAFPDDFVLTGSYAQQWERLGRAVPPVMMKTVAETIRDQVLGPLSGTVSRGGR